MRTEHELHGRRRGRNIGLGLALIALVALIFAVTVVKLGANAANPSSGVSWGEQLMNWWQE